MHANARILHPPGRLRNFRGPCKIRNVALQMLLQPWASVPLSISLSPFYSLSYTIDVAPCWETERKVIHIAPAARRFQSCCEFSVHNRHKFDWQNDQLMMIVQKLGTHSQLACPCGFLTTIWLLVCVVICIYRYLPCPKICTTIFISKLREREREVYATHANVPAI
jgi:hypothetical protein